MYNVRSTMYGCTIAEFARVARRRAELKRAGCPKAVIGRDYKGAGIWGGPGRGMGNGLNELGANFIGRRVDRCGVCP